MFKHGLTLLALSRMYTYSRASLPNQTHIHTHTRGKIPQPLDIPPAHALSPVKCSAWFNPCVSSGPFNRSPHLNVRAQLEQPVGLSEGDRVSCDKLNPSLLRLYPSVLLKHRGRRCYLCVTLISLSFLLPLSVL